MSLPGTFHVVKPRPAAECTTYLCYTCSCKYYQDRGKFKHVLREGLLKKNFSVPLMQMLGLGSLGIRKKKGRPLAS